MNVELFSILDQAANRYMDPFPGPTVDFGIRGFKEACRTDGHQFQKFPEDYALYHIATFHPDSGEIFPITPHKIAMATSFVNGAQLDLERGA